jgi:hypothetical protein
VAGKFSKHHKRYIREEDNKSNKQVMDKVLGEVWVDPAFFEHVAEVRDSQNSLRIE